MDPNLTDTLVEFFDRKADSYGLLLVYLFGSRATSEVGPMSDYDFAVLFDHPPDSRERCQLAHEIVEIVKTDRVDLVPLNRAPIELRYAVIVTGYTLYKKSEYVRVEFEAETLTRYFDYLPVLRRQREEILQEKDYEAGIQRYRAALGKTENVLAEIRAAQKEG